MIQTGGASAPPPQGQLAKQYVQDPSGTIIEAYTYEYDSLGRIIQSRAEDVNGETVQRIQQLYDNANRLSSQHWEIQGDSYEESYTYDADDGSLQSMTTAGGQTLSYTYDFLKRHSATTVKNGSSTIFTVAKSYYNQTTDTTLTTAQVQYYNVRNSAGTLIAGSQYVYDARGNITQIKESESPYRLLVEYDYDDLNQLVSETTYTYTGTSTTPSSTTVNRFEYDTAGNLLRVYDSATATEPVDEYTYGNSDWQDLLTKFNGTTISYDASGNPLNWYNGNTYSGLSWVMGRQLESMTVETDSEELDISYSYDMSGIRSGKTVVIGEVEAHTHEYTSVVTAPTCTTAGYTTYTCDCGESYVDNLVDALGHNYVQSGNVYTCSRCGDSYTGHEHSYTEETTEPTCLTAGYTVYTCSCGDTYTVDLPALGHNYVLVNQSGNVATYECSRCGHRYTAIVPVDPQPPVEYSLRSSSPTEHHEYIYASGKLLRETITTTSGTTTTTEVLDFIYGSGSAPLALVYTNGTASPVTYYYITNMQGDVVKMVSASGTVVAEYAYDAWGKVLTATGSMAEVNPIRYRGYYYDAETGLYYLQSRYYDPSVKRFINADAVSATGQGFLGYNMFAYCGNCPVGRIDLSGNAWWGVSECVYSDARIGYTPYVASNRLSEHSLNMKLQVKSLLDQDRYSKDAWNNASPDEKEAIREQFAKECAAILGVPEYELYICLGENTVGGWNEYLHRLSLNPAYVNDYSILKTIAHELYHAYQYIVCNSTEPTNEPVSTVVAWKLAIRTFDGSETGGIYNNSPLENSAHWFADQLLPGRVKSAATKQSWDCLREVI